MEDAIYKKAVLESRTAIAIGKTVEGVIEEKKAEVDIPGEKVTSSVRVRRCAVCGAVPIFDNPKQTKTFHGQVATRTRIRLKCPMNCPGQEVTKNSMPAVTDEWNRAQIIKFEARVKQAHRNGETTLEQPHFHQEPKA